jgi:diazepam-binding inhibitor (GABA receptor modulating acyl-CoA-binding protein)
MLSSNSKEFLTAVEYVRKLSTTPSTDELGELYGLYKQATIGDINIPKPSFIYFKETSKWNSWNKYSGLEKNDAEVRYITTVNELIQKYGIN